MSEGSYRIYELIVGSTSSDLVLFFIIMAILAIPLCIVISKSRKADREHEREREAQILQVIKENSAVIASLKAALDSSQTEMTTKVNKF